MEKGRYQRLFDKIKKEAITVDYSPAEKELPVGTSKFGGKPYLPKDFVWPYYEEADFEGINKNRPLSFIAQINLEEIAGYDKDNQLPHSGMLYFFYELCTMKWGFDPKDEGCARVFFVDTDRDLQTAAFPEDMEEYCILPEFKMQFSGKTDLPYYEEISEYVTDLEWDQYDEESALYGYEMPEEGISKLLGYADIIQNSMLLECEEVCNGIYCGGIPTITEEQKKEMLERSREWILLFQISTLEKEGYELMFGDCGSIYFYIRKQDLQERNFENVWMILQCF